MAMRPCSIAASGSTTSPQNNPISMQCATPRSRLCFLLRAVNRILSDDDQPNRTKINRLWDVLDEPKFNRALGLQQNRHGISGELKGFADFRRDRNGNIVPRLCVANRSGRPPTLLDLFELSWLLFRLPTKPPARPRTIANNQRRVPTGDARALILSSPFRSPATRDTECTACRYGGCRRRTAHRQWRWRPQTASRPCRPRPRP
jgi:hypothetical protein